MLRRRSDAITLGSLFPDMVISARVSHAMAHSLGAELLYVVKENHALADFARGIITHGISPHGLDYFGDEKYPGCERGYCFEKGRPLVKHTIEACNIPPEMGWWKAHNIVEMGIELRISNRGAYGHLIHQAFNNQELIDQITSLLGELTGYREQGLKKRIAGFPGYIEIYKATAQSLADKYQVQMFARHGININTVKVARLIEIAAEQVEDDLDDFFRYTYDIVLRELDKIERY
ncbi:hypothetical protein [Desulfoscipio gibsoniae]|uniref:Uncharacterized protein n=1 Tax=Desulfoscipio gibsoniae DSM 7213 TaxID=767817 RepID=R4KMA4_9FIRM|nr:hypothetical protein [Desulfoscipio gibsoniae]AGL02687.1 hypothetical protein Desgi_3342 [Desulfoscipio gibsoniae DSM 7213]